MIWRSVCGRGVVFGDFLHDVSGHVTRLIVPTCTVNGK